MNTYQLTDNPSVVLKNPNTRIVLSEHDRQPHNTPLRNSNAMEIEYREWLAAGNVPDPPSDADRELIRARLHQERRDVRTKEETSGFMFNGHPFDSDRDSILRINNAATAALAAIALDTHYAVEWMCADGYEMPLDAFGVLGMQAALAAHGAACHARSRALKQEIDAGRVRRLTQFGGG